MSKLCVRCGYNAQYNWSGFDVCGEGCFRLIMESNGLDTSKYDHATQSWKLTLSKYHRDNLLWLLNAIGYPYGHHIEPFHCANTGDWVGEIALMLAKPNQQPLLDKEDQPNITAEQLQDNINFWKKNGD